MNNAICIADKIAGLLVVLSFHVRSIYLKIPNWISSKKVMNAMLGNKSKLMKKPNITLIKLREHLRPKYICVTED